MKIDPQLLQFIGSLAAILVLAAIAWGLKLGPERLLEDDESARLTANEAVDGFEAQEVALDRNGRGALLQDGAGAILLLRPHGTHFAGRILGPLATARLEDGELLIDTAEKRYGSARLDLADAQAWVKRIEAIR